MPKWRKATWALIIWTGLMVVWAATGVGALSENCAGLTGQDLELCQAGTAIGGGIGVTFIFFIWFVGFIILGIIWFMSRPKENVVVYGPAGQQMMVSEKEAQKRISSGWTYQPAPPSAPTPPPTDSASGGDAGQPGS